MSKNQMKSNSASNISKVFSFTLAQTVKGKSFIVTTLIMAVVFFAIMPITNSMQGKSGNIKMDGIDSTKIEKVYVANNLGFEQKDFEQFKKDFDGIYKDVDLFVVEGNMDTVKGKLDKDAGHSLAVSIGMSLDDGGILIEVRKSAESELGTVDSECFGENFQEYFDKLRREKSGLTEEQVKFVNRAVDVSAVDINENEKADDDEDTGALMNESSIVMLLFVACIMMFTMAGENIATSLITEKSTRVIEYILVSIKSFELVMGKILATIVTVIGQVVLYALAAAASYFVFASENMTFTQATEAMNISGFMNQVTPVTVVLGILILILGFATYTTLASLIGATASKLEQLQETIMVYSMICVVGAYSAMILLMKSYTGSAFDKFILAFPLSAPFISPVFVMSGKVGLGMTAIILAIQIVVLAALVWLVSKVFEGLILYNGARVKLKDLRKFMSSNAGVANVATAGAESADADAATADKKEGEANE